MIKQSYNTYCALQQVTSYINKYNKELDVWQIKEGTYTNNYHKELYVWLMEEGKFNKNC